MGCATEQNGCRNKLFKSFATMVAIFCKTPPAFRFSGLISTLALQNATAVALLTVNFQAKGVLSPTSGLAMLLGADIGSALAAELLLLKQAFLIPLLFVLGVALFLRNKTGIK